MRLPHVIALWTLFAAVLALGHAGSAAPAPRINCAPRQLTSDLDPLTAGPLALAATYCQVVRLTGLPRSAAVVSPDARSIAYYEHDTILRVARLDGRNAWTDYPADLGVFARFGSEIRSVPAFAWASNSQFLWTGTHERMRPNGFAKTPMQPVLTADGGRLHMLPPLQHGGGALDALLWADGDGRAVAQFGTRVGVHQLNDPHPAFAIVEAARGHVLDTLPFAVLDSLRDRPGGTPPYVLVRNAAAVTLRDGKVRALLSVGQWVIWTQGEPPRAMPDPYAGEGGIRMALSADGSRIVVARLLRTGEGGGCYHLYYGCVPGRPVEGILAAAHDLATGQAIWTIRATATSDYEFPTPAVSPDGRYALVGLMPIDNRPHMALVNMDDGTIVQTLPAWGHDYAMGFARGGRTVWTHAAGVTALYDLKEQ